MRCFAQKFDCKICTFLVYKDTHLALCFRSDPTGVPGKWHLNSSNDFSRVHGCDRRTDDRQKDRQTDHAAEKYPESRRNRLRCKTQLCLPNRNVLVSGKWWSENVVYSSENVVEECDPVTDLVRVTVGRRVNHLGM